MILISLLRWGVLSVLLPCAVGGLLLFAIFVFMVLSPFLIGQSAGASCLFDKHPHLNQSLCKARLCQKKYYPVAQRSGWRFFLSKPVGLGLDVKGIVEKFAAKKMGGIIDQGFQTPKKTYKVAGSMGGGTERLMPDAVKRPNGGMRRLELLS
ncbi:hypothetical protein ACFOG5_19295 [Pedobacter fastidiosus]|uniref:Uncharacterized protein n=1 Tax=Pedobacter fastidiosus TaxID=2765361 RepID=A0ABR7KXZ6_9SPHI|nr:hypothetical protein [Pedobacter fastidiosus]MBC6112994.1 hypothetical protein [Pedobacter fastidiosus]